MLLKHSFSSFSYFSAVMAPIYASIQFGEKVPLDVDSVGLGTL